MKEVKKGSVIYVDGWWFVVVEQHGEKLFCICDNANNIYSYMVSECEHIATPLEAMRAANWGEGGEKFQELLQKRSIPVDVIAEVLSGCHDGRFDHWTR